MKSKRSADGSAAAAAGRRPAADDAAAAVVAAAEGRHSHSNIPDANAGIAVVSCVRTTGQPMSD